MSFFRTYFLVLVALLLCQPIQADTQSLTKDGDYYLIGTAADFKAFADLVNGGEYEAMARMTADIDFTSSSYQTTMVGDNLYHPYMGTFNGDGHKLTVDYYNVYDVATAPFRHICGATIKNLTVAGKISTNKTDAAGIAGVVTGSSTYDESTIENCVSAVVITSSVNNEANHGGLVGKVISGALTIRNSCFVGEINGVNTKGCAGLVGHSDLNNGSDLYIANCFACCKLNNNGDNGTLFLGNGTVSNSYYLKSQTNVNGTVKEEKSFANGEVCYLLNGSQDAGTSWYQEIGKDKYPLPYGTRVVYKKGEKYSNINATLDGDTINYRNMVIADASTFWCGTEFVAKKISYTRPLTNQWGTACLPFPVKGDSKVQYFTLYKTDASVAGSPALQFVENKEEIPANTPVVFCICNFSTLADDEKVYSVEATDVTIQPTKATYETSVFQDQWKLIGTYSTLSLEKNSTHYYISNNMFNYDKSSVAEYITVKPFRAYFEKVGTWNSAQKYDIDVVDPETSIKIVTTSGNPTSGRIQKKGAYNLLGQPVKLDEHANRVCNNAYGIVIINGKKVKK